MHGVSNGNQKEYLKVLLRSREKSFSVELSAANVSVGLKTPLAFLASGAGVGFHLIAQRLGELLELLKVETLIGSLVEGALEFGAELLEVFQPLLVRECCRWG